MKREVKLLGTLGLAMTLVHCASGPVSSEKGLSVKVKASYFDKVAAQRVEDVAPGLACPHGNLDSKTDWKRLVGMASACVKANDWAKTETLGNTLSVRAPLTPWGPYYLALAAEARRDFPRAIWMLELALKKAPREGILQYQMGRIHWQLGNDTLALQFLRESAESNPTLTEAHWVNGMMALNAGQMGEAEAAFEKALKSYGRHWPSLMGLADVKIQLKDYSRAESLLQRALQFNDRSLRARLALAVVQETQLKKFHEALVSYKDIQRLNAEQKLDAPLNLNLDEKIRSIESALAKAEKLKASVRQPAAQEGKVAQ